MEFSNIDIATFQAQFQGTEAPRFRLIDVREVGEYADGHLPGAENLPLSELEARFGELERGETLVLVCQMGGRSAMAAQFLAAQGYTDLYNLVDGTFGWMTQQLPLEK